MKQKVAIYHMTNNPKRNSCIPLEVNILKKYATNQDWEIVGEYIDKSIKQCDKTELQKAINESDAYDILLIKYAYYLSRSTETYLKILKELKAHNTKVFSINDGWC